MMYMSKFSFTISWALGATFVGFAVLQANRREVQESILANVDYYSPSTNGGSMLIDAGWGLGEPLNVVISGRSSPQVLTDKGFVNYARAIGFSKECLGIHLGDPMLANLGDGNGWVDQTMELRQHYGNVILGTCWESLIGGNHFRWGDITVLPPCASSLSLTSLPTSVYRQNGVNASSGALFLAVSKEENVTAHHTIVPDGYNIGRDDLATRAAGIKTYRGVRYSTSLKNVTGLLSPGSDGINHSIATDGITVLLTVTIQ